jgi:hypothetical protein
MLIVRGSASFASRARSRRASKAALGGERDGDHLAAFFRRADREDLHARARLLEHAHVLVDLFAYGSLPGAPATSPSTAFGVGTFFDAGR